MNHRMRSVLFAAVSGVVMAACVGDPPTTPLVGNPRQLDDRAMLARLGYRTDMVEDKGNYYLVEGDLSVPKSWLRGRGANLQYAISNTVSTTKQRKRLHPRVPVHRVRLVSSNWIVLQPR